VPCFGPLPGSPSALGRIGHLGRQQRQERDNRYPAGIRTFVGTQAGYFSVGAGATNLNNFNTSTGLDFGDWAHSAGSDAFRAAGGSGVVNPVTATDLRKMDILGYRLAPSGQTIINSTPGAVIIGGPRDDIITATGGNATITGRPGNDTITGGVGTNTSVYSGASKNYTIALTEGVSAFTVQDKVGTDGTDTLTSIQKLQFTDRALDTTWFTKTAALSASQLTSLGQIYIASFNHAPDALGLDYWGSRLHDGMSLNDIAASFFVQPEAAAAYPAGQSTSAFVTQVYGNVLGRAPDSAGLAYWTSQLGNGGVGKNTFLLAVINGATGSDTQTLANKATVGLHFAVAQGLSDSGWAKTVMAGVDSMPASISTATTQTDAQHGRRCGRRRTGREDPRHRQLAPATAH
jgi:hypothetical protein